MPRKVETRLPLSGGRGQDCAQYELNKKTRPGGIPAGDTPRGSWGGGSPGRIPLGNPLGDPPRGFPP